MTRVHTEKWRNCCPIVEKSRRFCSFPIVSVLDVGYVRSLFGSKAAGTWFWSSPANPHFPCVFLTCIRTVLLLTVYLTFMEKWVLEEKCFDVIKRKDFLWLNLFIHMCFFCDVNSDVSGGTTIISCNSGRWYWWTCHIFMKHHAGRYILSSLLYKIHRSLCFMFSFCSAVWWVDDVLLI